MGALDDRFGAGTEEGLLALTSPPGLETTMEIAELDGDAFRLQFRWTKGDQEVGIFAHDWYTDHLHFSYLMIEGPFRNQGIYEYLCTVERERFFYERGVKYGTAPAELDSRIGAVGPWEETESDEAPPIKWVIDPARWGE